MKRATRRRAAATAGTYLIPAALALLLLLGALAAPRPGYLAPTEGGVLAPGLVRVDGRCRMDINTATEEQLQLLPGIGEALARAIVEDRAENGPFADTEALARVHGIGPGKLAAIGELICAAPYGG